MPELNIPVTDFKLIDLPGHLGASFGTGFVRVTDVPPLLDTYMEVNPRVPSRRATGVLSGPVAKGILSTLRERPEEMVLKNQGIYLLAERALHTGHSLRMVLEDPGKHGIVNGGHTYAAIREAVENASDDERTELERAYVRFNVYTGIDEDLVPEIAEGLNRSKQVDDPSLVNLQGDFEPIRAVLHGTPAEKAIAYHQGDSGDIYIAEVLVYLGMFNQQRYSERKHPNALYNRQSLGLIQFKEDLVEAPVLLQQRIKLLPSILWLADNIRKLTPSAANKQHLKFGRLKVGSTRIGSKENRGTPLPFIGESTNYRVPNGWLYPMLAAFRANLTPDMRWRVPLAELLPAVIDDLVAVCVLEHRDNNLRPELIGKRESAYSQCYTRTQLYLARHGLLDASMP